MTALAPLTRYRQSLLASFETCPRRTRFAIEAGDDSTRGWVEATGDLGRALHAVVAEILRTLWRQGEQQMSTQESVEILYEVLAAGDIVLPADQRDELRWLVLNFADLKWRPERIMALEEELTCEVVCPDGEVRTLKGQPDILIADPPRGLIVGDWKSSRAVPRSPRTPPEEGQPIEGREYLSARGHFQGDCYGLLAMRAYPSVEYIVFREYHLRSGEIREARLSRDELEHVERELAQQMMLLDRAVREGEGSALWRPRPGKHCAKQCPVARSCTVPAEQRGDGAIESEEMADDVAALATVAGAQATQSVKQLKVWQEAGNRPGRPNERQEFRWGPEPDAWMSKGGGRKFGLWPREDVAMASTTEGTDGD